MSIIAGRRVVGTFDDATLNTELERWTPVPEMRDNFGIVPNCCNGFQAVPALAAYEPNSYTVILTSWHVNQSWFGPKMEFWWRSRDRITLSRVSISFSFNFLVLSCTSEIRFWVSWLSFLRDYNHDHISRQGLTRRTSTWMPRKRKQPKQLEALEDDIHSGSPHYKSEVSDSSPIPGMTRMIYLIEY